MNQTNVVVGKYNFIITETTMAMAIFGFSMWSNEVALANGRPQSGLSYSYLSTFNDADLWSAFIMCNGVKNGVLNANIGFSINDI